MSVTVEGGTKIEWTHQPGFKGETWNPVTGCDRISPGCANCYARTMARRLKAMGQPRYQTDGDGPGFGVAMHRDALDTPRRWKKPRCVFVNSMSDLFHDDVDEGNIRDIYSSMAMTPQHRYLILTKRPDRARALYERGVLASRWVMEWPLPNVWLGVSIENSRFTWRADVLRQIPAAVRFISAEPLLASLFEDARDPKPLDVTLEERRHIRHPLNLDGIDWVIVGGESGPGARPCDLEHVREVIEACLLHFERPAIFVKQLGKHPVGGRFEVDRPVKLRDAKGGDLSEWPEDLRIREVPGDRS